MSEGNYTKVMCETITANYERYEVLSPEPLSGNLYAFTRYDLSRLYKVCGKFITCVDLGMQEGIYPTPERCPPPVSILTQLRTTPKNLWWKTVSKYPLSYFCLIDKVRGEFLCDTATIVNENGDLEEAKSSQNFALETTKSRSSHVDCTQCSLRLQLVNRDALLNRATDPLCIEWWTFPRMCEIQAVFITYPLCRLLWPKEEFSVIQTDTHTMVINDNTGVIYDPISQCNRLDMDAIGTKFVYIDDCPIYWYRAKYRPNEPIEKYYPYLKATNWVEGL